MRDKVTYEWVFEEYDEYGDIVDPLFSESLTGALGNAEDVGENKEYAIALVRFTGNPEDGETSRDYAYLDKKNRLPLEFPNEGTRVPQIYHRIVKRTFNHGE